MKAKACTLNIDRLEVCYTASVPVVEELIDTAYMERSGYRIIAQESENNETILQVDIVAPEGGPVWMSFASIKIGSTFETEDSPFRYVWIRVDNRVLYTPLYPSSPVLSYLFYIAEDLSLIYNNITRLDIAVDSGTNYPVRIKKAVRDMSLTPVVLGKAYPEPKEIIGKLLYIHTGDRIRYRTDNITLSSADKDEALCVYNKTEEIKESGKDYIAEWDGIKGTIYRAEVRLKRAALKDYLNSKGLTFEELYLNILNKERLLDLFLFYSDRLIRFRRGRDTINLLQL